MSAAVEFMPPVDLREYLGMIPRSDSAFEDVTLTLRGRDAIALATRHFGFGADDLVLLPGYICDTVPAGFGSACRFEYYDIREDFTIDPELIDHLLSTRPVRVLYVIHYLGFLQPNLPELSRICKKHGVLLWEDQAHSALSRFSRAYADAMIFSFRKVLPVPDGGGLWLRGVPPTTELSRSALASDLISMVMLAKRMHVTERLLLSRVLKTALARDVDALKFGRKSLSPRPMSHMSQRIVRHTDLSRLFEIRREQYRCWLDLLAGGPLRPAFQHLPDDVAALGCPIWVDNSNELVDRFRGYGIFLKIHWQSRLEEAHAKCPTALGMSNSIVTLPIYPGLSEADMRRVVALLGRHARPAAGIGC